MPLRQIANGRMQRLPIRVEAQFLFGVLLWTNEIAVKVKEA